PASRPPSTARSEENGLPARGLQSSGSRAGLRRPGRIVIFSFFAGKGGVGKTTCAAAEAVALAARGRRVLAVSTDPAHSLGDALGERLSARPRRISRGLFAAELDADRALSRWFQKRERAFRL